MVFVIVTIVICLTVYGIIVSKHNAEEKKAFWGTSDSADIKQLKNQIAELTDRVSVLEKRLDNLDEPKFIEKN